MLPLKPKIINKQLIHTYYLHFYPLQMIFKKFLIWLQNESTCLANSSSKGMERQIFTRLLASGSTFLSGCMVFSVASPNSDIYEFIFKSSGVILGTLVAIYVIGKTIWKYFGVFLIWLYIFGFHFCFTTFWDTSSANKKYRTIGNLWQGSNT